MKKKITIIINYVDFNFYHVFFINYNLKNAKKTIEKYSKNFAGAYKETMGIKLLTLRPNFATMRLFQTDFLITVHFGSKNMEKLRKIEGTKQGEH